MLNIIKILEKIKVGFIKQVVMVAFSGMLGIGQVEDQIMIKEKLLDGKKLLLDLEVN